MKKTILVTSMTLALGVSTSASAANFFAANATYRVDVTGGCMAFGNCTTLAQNVGTGSFTITTDATGDAYTVGIYSGIDYTGTPGGLFQTGGPVAGSGTVTAAGQLDLNFTGRTGVAQYFPQYAGAAWNIDDNTKVATTGVYEGYTTASDSNLDPTTGALSLTLTGTNLVTTGNTVAGQPSWTGELVSVGNVGAAWVAFDGTPYSEVYNVQVVGIAGVPLAANDLVSTSVNTPLIINIANDMFANDTHPVIAEALTLQSFTAPASGGGLVDNNNNGTLTYTPVIDANGIPADSFTYTVADSNGDTATAQVNINVGIGAAPVAKNDTGVTVNEDSAVTFDPVVGVDPGTTADTDVEDPTSALVIVDTELPTVAQNGTVTRAGNAVTYTPDANFNGSDAFSYRIQDTDGNLSLPATVTVTVNPVNDAPVCSDVTLTTAVDTALLIDVANDLLLTTGTAPLCTDVDGDNLSLAAIDPAGSSGGTMATNSANELNYTPASGFKGTETFSFTATDGTLNAVPNTLSIDVADASLSNFTMLDKGGNVFGGTNDVVIEWDEVSTNGINVDTNGIAADTDFGKFITVASGTRFNGFNWKANRVRVFKNTTTEPITLKFDVTCTAADYDSGKVDCSSNPLGDQDAIQRYMTLTLEPDQVGVHILFDWNLAKNIDVALAWKEDASWDTYGKTAPTNQLWLGNAGIAPSPTTDWRFVSSDVPGDGKGGINGTPMVDGAFIGFYANFNYKPATTGEKLPPVDTEISEVETGGFSIEIWTLLAGLFSVFGLRRIKNKK